MNFTPPNSSVEPLREWAVVNTQPHREAMAFAHLTRQGFEVYYPKMIKKVRSGRVTIDAPRPMFPGYAFVRWDDSVHRWRAILSTRGVKTLVCCGDQPSFIANDFIDGLMEREIEGVIQRPSGKFQIGQSVRMSGGPFDGLVSKVIGLEEHDRVIVLMQMLQRQVRVKVDVGRVHAIKDDA